MNRGKTGRIGGLQSGPFSRAYALTSLIICVLTVHGVRHHKWHNIMLYGDIALLVITIGVLTFWESAQRSWTMRLTFVLNVFSFMVSTVVTSRA